MFYSNFPELQGQGFATMFERRAAENKVMEDRAALAAAQKVGASGHAEWTGQGQRAGHAGAAQWDAHPISHPQRTHGHPA